MCPTGTHAFQNMRALNTANKGIGQVDCAQIARGLVRNSILNSNISIEHQHIRGRKDPRLYETLKQKQ